MNIKLMGFALAATVATAGFAYADSVTVQSGGASSGVVVKERTHPGVVVHERATVGAGVDCSKKKVTHKNELTGTKVTKTTTNCD
jgi:FlaG/FlaF family flagellin (archaellin)